MQSYAQRVPNNIFTAHVIHPGGTRRREIIGREKSKIAFEKDGGTKDGNLSREVLLQRSPREICICIENVILLVLDSPVELALEQEGQPVPAG